MKKLLFAALIALSACTKTVPCPEKKGGYYEAVSEKGDTAKVYQFYFNPFDVRKIGETVFVDECLFIGESGKGMIKYTIISEPTPVSHRDKY